MHSGIVLDRLLICQRQVPEDLQSILNDSSLHNGSAELTTKEILSRYGDIVKGNVQRQTVTTADAPVRSPTNSTKTGTPVAATRVDVDPYQATAWQKQSSVRPVQNVGPATSAPPNEFHFGVATSPYARARAGSQGSQGSYGGAAGMRQSYQPNPGAMGVTG